MQNFIDKNFSSIFYSTIAISIFPFWLLSGFSKSYFSLLFVVSIFSVFLVLLLIKAIIKQFSLELKAKIFILSFFLTYGFDLNFKLLTFLRAAFEILTKYSSQGIYFYIFIVLFMLLIFLIIYYILKINLKNSLIFLAVMGTLVFFNIFNLINNIYFFDKNLNSNIKFIKKSKVKNHNLNLKDKTIIIFLDNLSGYSGIEEKIGNGKLAKNSYIKTFKNNNFTLYENAYSSYFKTDISVSAALNFNYQKNSIKEIEKYRSLNKNEYFKWKLNKNKLFENFSDGKIYTTTNKNIDFCDKKLVSICERFFPSHHYDYLENLQFSKVDNFFYLLLKSNSVVNKIAWRIFFETGLTNDYPIWTYLKANFPHRLSNFAKNIVNTDYDLYFAHYLVPHSPFGYKLSANKKCSFDFKLIEKEKKFSLKEEISHHYDEIICLNNYFSQFFELLKNSNHFDNLTIIILSDTGSGYGNDSGKKVINFKNTYPSLFAIKNNLKDKMLHKENSIIWSTQYLFSYYLNKDHKETKDDEKIIYDHYNSKYLNYKSE